MKAERLVDLYHQARRHLSNGRAHSRNRDGPNLFCPSFGIMVETRRSRREKYLKRKDAFDV